MADTAEVVEESAETTPSTGSLLSQYVAEVEELTGERVTDDFPNEEPEGETESEKEASEEESSKKEEEPPKPAPVKKPPVRKPAEVDFTRPDVQAEIDRRAAALERSKRAEFERKAADEAANQARIAERAEYEELVSQAQGDDFDEVTQQARKKLANRESTRMWREVVYAEVAPAIRGAVVDDLQDQLSAGYESIPEFRYKEVSERLHNGKYNHAGQWLKDTVDGISAIRVADAKRQWEATFDTEMKAKARELAEAMTAEEVAKIRSKLPNPDISPNVTDGREEMRYRSRGELARDVDKILPRIGSDAYRALRDSLPED